jgi:endonuclease G, mitochondrial
MDMKGKRRSWGRRWPFLLMIVLAVGHANVAAAQPFSACANEFWQQRPPEVAAVGPFYALCASHFATLYSSRTETPVYSAEHLTGQQVADAIHIPRHDDFHEDDRLPISDGATLDEYRGSGYDRGHMAPSGDEPDARSQYESFALSNMVPQDANDNRYLWADIETAVRELVLAGGDEIYVVTGPLFNPNGALALHGRLEVPTFIFKAVYDPAGGFAGVYVARNAPGWKFWKLSISDFQSRFGIEPFPGLQASILASGNALPDPLSARHFHSHS